MNRLFWLVAVGAVSLNLFLLSESLWRQIMCSGCKHAVEPFVPGTKAR